MNKVEQISIFLENKPGGLELVTRVLRDAGINIRALSLADTSDFGVLRLIVNDAEKAKQVLKENGFTVGRTSVVAVLVPDRPGGLHSILEVLSKEKVNVEYMYAYVERSGETRHHHLPIQRDGPRHRNPDEERVYGVAGGESLQSVDCKPALSFRHPLEGEDWGEGNIPVP